MPAENPQIEPQPPAFLNHVSGFLGNFQIYTNFKSAASRFMVSNLNWDSVLAANHHIFP